MQTLTYKDCLRTDSVEKTPDIVSAIKAIFSVKKKVKSSVSNGNYGSIESIIYEYYHESKEKRKDNYFEKSIKDENISFLINLLYNEIPDNCIAPGVHADPRGYLGLEWISLDGDRLVIVLKEDKIIYASIIGEVKDHSELNIDNGIPSSIYKTIKEYFSK